MDMDAFVKLASVADRIGIKLEISGGRPTWEAFPGMRHQKAIRRIERSIEPLPEHGDCGCFDVSDAYIRLPDGSLKRPDVAIFCVEPPDVDEAVDVIPGAVVEVVSKGYEQKDLEDNPPLYLQNGVLDVIVLDPRTSQVFHHRAGTMVEHTSPVTLDLLCGCRVTV